MAGARTQWLLTVTALPLTYLCGWLSWHYVEMPTLSLRRYLPRRTPRPASPRPDAPSATPPGPGTSSGSPRHRLAQLRERPEPPAVPVGLGVAWRHGTVRTR
jgi:hypothetical protein